MHGARTSAPGVAPPGALSVPGGVSAARRRFATLLVFATLFLIFAGAEVKSRQAGLAVPDWPLSYGMWWPPMVGNIFYEHGHRTVAATIGLLTLVLAVWTARRESRAGVRRLGWWMLAAVVAQGALGGLTVLFLLPTPVSMGHALLAQTFLCLVVAMAHLTSRRRLHAPAEAHPGGAEAAFRAARLAVVAIFVQLLLGALMRHTEAGLAVPFFPVSAEGDWLPAAVDARVVIHLAHRVFALVVIACVVRAALVTRRAVPGLTRHALGSVVLVLLQAALGASVIWTAGVAAVDGSTPLVAPVPASLHVTCGAALLACGFWLLLRCAPAAAAHAPRATPAADAAPAGASA